MKSVLGVTSVLALTLTVGCGSEKDSTKLETVVPTKTTEGRVSVSQSTLVVQSTDDTPDCTKQDQGKLVYVVDEGTFKYCNQESWASIDLKGQRGEIGAKGDSGERGAAGLTLKEVWRFQTPTYIGQQDVCAESDSATCYLVPIQEWKADLRRGCALLE